MKRREEKRKTLLPSSSVKRNTRVIEKRYHPHPLKGDHATLSAIRIVRLTSPIEPLVLGRVIDGKKKKERRACTLRSDVRHGNF